MSKISDFFKKDPAPVADPAPSKREAVEREAAPAPAKARSHKAKVEKISPLPLGDPAKRVFRVVCHFCGEQRMESLKRVLKLADGTVAHFCETCIAMWREEHAKRCLSCGEVSSQRRLTGVCVRCRGEGAHTLDNLLKLVGLRWVGVIRG